MTLTFGALALSCSSNSSNSAADTGIDAGMDAGIDAGAGPSADLCSSMCAVVLQVTCPNPPTMMDCVTECLGEMACPAETTAYFTCLVANGAASLECNQVLESVVLKDGYCTKESADFVACIQM